ncbi:MAG: hypothetical protein DI539_09430, partial [Flavobacterium psychrophilum]
KFCICDYNPVSPFWATESLLGRDDVDFITVTYKDNEFLKPKIIRGIEMYKELSEKHPNEAVRKQNLNLWRVMGLGLMGQSESVIYADWDVIEELPEDAELMASGLDFGFTNDPTTLISLYRYNGELIADEKIYKKGLLNSDIGKLIKNTDATEAIIYADSAEPKSIAELKTHGLPVIPVVKGKDSVNYGISLVQSQHIKVTERSKNLISELQNYSWVKDKQGNTLNIPVDNWNHALDALRYIFLMKFGKKSTFKLKYNPNSIYRK